MKPYIDISTNEQGKTEFSLHAITNDNMRVIRCALRSYHTSITELLVDGKLQDAETKKDFQYQLLVTEMYITLLSNALLKSPRVETANGVS